MDRDLDKLLDSKVLTTNRCKEKTLHTLICRLRENIQEEKWECIIELFERIVSTTGDSSRRTRNSFATIVQHASVGPNNYVKCAKLALLRVLDETVGGKSPEVEPVKPQLTCEILKVLE